MLRISKLIRRRRSTYSYVLIGLFLVMATAEFCSHNVYGAHGGTAEFTEHPTAATRYTNLATAENTSDHGNEDCAFDAEHNPDFRPPSSRTHLPAPLVLPTPSVSEFHFSVAKQQAQAVALRAAPEAFCSGSHALLDVVRLLI